MTSTRSKAAKQHYIPLSSEDDEEPIYQPFRSRHQPKTSPTDSGKRSLSPSPRKAVKSTRQASPDSPDLSADSPRRLEERVRTPNNGRQAGPTNRVSHSRNGTPAHNTEHCGTAECEICQALMNRKSASGMVVASGEVWNAGDYDPSKHTLDKPMAGQTRSRSVDPTRHKPFFAKKLAQLDATMKVLAAKVDQNIWEEKYTEAEELQAVLVWLRNVHAKLKKLLLQRSEKLDTMDLAAAQAAKTEYEQTLKESVNLASIQRLLSPTEYQTLLSLQQQY